MNNVAISNHLLVNLLQSQNVKRETVKKKEIIREEKDGNTIENDDNKPVVDDLITDGK